MDFLLALIVYASSHDISRDEMQIRHQNYCQNLYFQPNAAAKLSQASCDLADTEYEIAFVTAGKY
ncbi:hypothetical protein GW846_02990 [Candidatus Gracilibacteria bacterium]|nr:hypothetical protein [Candidatus Gracilibacteria bacterium]